MKNWLVENVEDNQHHWINRFAEMIRRRESLAEAVIGFMDGLSPYYGGYHSDTMVNNVIAYGPDGKVFFAAINFPGSWLE